MEFFAILIALVALVIAVMAFHRTGGLTELRQKVENLTMSSETMRERTANMLDRFEQMVRGKDKTAPEPKPEPTKEPGTNPSTKAE